MNRALFAPLAALALAGCISFGEDPPAVLLNLTPTATVQPGSTASGTPGESVTVVTPGVPQSLATARIPVHSSDTEVAYLKDALWVETPDKLFQRLLSETIQARTGRPVLSPSQFSLDPGTRISGELLSFGVDAPAFEAVVTYDAAVSRDGGTRVETRRFEARVPVTAIESAAVGVALNQAANQVAGEVAAWIGG